MEESQFRWYLRLAVDTVRYEGLHILLWRMVQFLFSPIGHLGVLSFCRMDLGQPLPEIPARVPVEIDQATEADIDQLAMMVSSRYGPSQRQELFSERTIEETIVDRFQHGAICFVARVRGEIAHYNWIFFHKYVWDPGGPCRISMGNHEALCDDGFTPEEWRGRGIHGAVNCAMLKFLQDSGFATAYTLVNSANLSSKKALDKVGWDFFANLLYLSLRDARRPFAIELRGPIAPFMLLE